MRRSRREGLPPPARSIAHCVPRLSVSAVRFLAPGSSLCSPPLQDCSRRRSDLLSLTSGSEESKGMSLIARDSRRRNREAQVVASFRPQRERERAVRLALPAPRRTVHVDSGRTSALLPRRVFRRVSHRAMLRRALEPRQVSTAPSRRRRAAPSGGGGIAARRGGPASCPARHEPPSLSGSLALFAPELNAASPEGHGTRHLLLPALVVARSRAARALPSSQPFLAGSRSAGCQPQPTHDERRTTREATVGRETEREGHVRGIAASGDAAQASAAGAPRAHTLTSY